MPGTLHIVDVFAEQRYAGNPLAVVTRADSLSSEQMQAIAAEINYSETTFVGSTVNADGSHPVRMFTPAREIAFAGHPILGTAWVIRHESPTPPASVVLDLQVGPVPVVFEADTQGREVCWFTAPPITLGPTCASEPIAAALGLSPGDIDPAGPVQQCGAGTAAMVVPLRSLAALRRCALDLGVYQALAAQGFPPLVYAFCRETRDPRNQLSARFFFEAHGVREDPATGNGAAFLGAYLLRHGLLGASDLSLRIEQGHEVRRPSLVQLRARLADDGPLIEVGGGVVPTVRGELV
ncbi:MAG: PhzF family phenazine biosynthesis protein [Rhodocyclaceae bacterium]|nr:PhzF family phenazine biosynthesis protein [Rhodocyclaceae bacterium]